jgi:hypothetical protein
LVFFATRNVKSKAFDEEMYKYEQEWFVLCQKGLVDPKKVDQKRRRQLSDLLIGMHDEVEAADELKDYENELDELSPRKRKNAVVNGTELQRELQQRRAIIRGSLQCDVKLPPLAVRSDVDIGFMIGGGYLHFDLDIDNQTGKFFHITFQFHHFPVSLIMNYKKTI